MQYSIKNYIEFQQFKKAYNPLLFALLGSQELVDKWWDSRNKAFGMLTPEDQAFKDWREVDYYLKQFYNK